jgi:hypothetical protein
VNQTVTGPPDGFQPCPFRLIVVPAPPSTGLNDRLGVLAGLPTVNAALANVDPSNTTIGL